MQEPNKTQRITAVVLTVVAVCLIAIGLYGTLSVSDEDTSGPNPAAETTVDVDPTPELAMRIVYGDSHWRWIVPLLIFFLVIDGTVITMYLASISKKLDRLPQAPSP